MHDRSRKRGFRDGPAASSGRVRCGRILGVSGAARPEPSAAIPCRVAVTLLLDSPDARLFTVRRSPLAELCACLHALDEPAHHPLSAGWVSAVHATLDASLLARAAAWAPLWGAFRARYLLPLSAGPRPAPRARLEQTSPVLGRSAEFGRGFGRAGAFS
jgi:hypothetical protein